MNDSVQVVSDKVDLAQTNSDKTEHTDTGSTVMHGPVYKTPLMSRIAQNLQQMATLSEAMRMMGALIMVASMSVFLLQGWSEGSDVNRYFLLLAQTVLMGVAGLAMSFLLRENKGARVFFNLSLVSVVANFAVLGALTYSTVQWDDGLASYPQFAHWVAQSTQSITSTMLVAALILLPVTLFGFMITARPLAVRLSLIYLALNSLLLLPFRDSLLTGVTILAGLVVLPIVLNKTFAGQHQLTAATVRFIKALLYAPLLIMLGRSVMLYAFNSVLMLSVSLAIFLTLRAFTQQSAQKQNTPKVLRVTADILAYISSFGIALAVAEMVEMYLPLGLLLPVFALTLALVNHELSGRIQHPVLKKAVRLMTGIVFMGGLMLYLYDVKTVWAALLCITAALSVMAYAWVYKDQLLLIPAVVGLVMGVLFHSDKAFDFIFEHSWISLAVMGALIIIAASVLERHGVVLKLRFQQWRTKLAV